MQEFVYDLKDGRSLTIDPVKTFNETDTHYVIDNGYYVYEILKADVVRWSFGDTQGEEYPLSWLEGEIE